MTSTTTELSNLFLDIWPTTNLRCNDGYFFVPKKQDLEDFLLYIVGLGLGWTSTFFDAFEIAASSWCYFIYQRLYLLKDKKLKIKDPEDPLYGEELTDEDLVRWSCCMFWGDLLGDGYQPYLGGMSQEKKPYIITYNTDFDFGVLEIDETTNVEAIRIYC